jgi:hypothetical protein
LVLSAALQIDKVRAKGAMKDIGIAKVSTQPQAFVKTKYALTHCLRTS